MQISPTANFRADDQPNDEKPDQRAQDGDLLNPIQLPALSDNPPGKQNTQWQCISQCQKQNPRTKRVVGKEAIPQQRLAGR